MYYDKLRTTDWNFDFSTLPRWDNRDRLPFVYDKFYPIPQSDMLCCIYSIFEVKMGWYFGFLAILKNKEHPEVVLNISDSLNFCDNFSTNKSGDIIFLQPCLHNEAKDKTECPILILDMIKKKFSYYKTDNINSGYKIVESGTSVFSIEADHSQKADAHLMALAEQKIDINILKWHDFSELNDFQNIYNKKRFRFF